MALAESSQPTELQKAAPNRRKSRRSPVKVGLAERILHLLRGPNPLNPAVWEGRLQPMTFRQLEDADIPACLEIYRLNETDRFPEGYIEEYRKALEAQRAYYLVGEQDGKIVATGGMQYFKADNLAVLCFGLVHPQRHNEGFGAALFLARMSLLKATEEHYHLFIGAVDKSIGYYRRFGFHDCQSWTDPHGRKQPSALLTITSNDILKSRQLLAAHGVVVPSDQSKIPLRELTGNGDAD